MKLVKFIDENVNGDVTNVEVLAMLNSNHPITESVIEKLQFRVDFIKVNMDEGPYDFKELVDAVLSDVLAPLKITYSIVDVDYEVVA